LPVPTTAIVTNAALIVAAMDAHRCRVTLANAMQASSVQPTW